MRYDKDLQRSSGDRVRLARWRRHLDQRGVTVPDVDDFLTFGKLSTLERLRNVLATEAPNMCGPLRAAIQELRRVKNAKSGSMAKGGRRGPVMEYSVDRDALPDAWRATLDAMILARRRVDAGGLHLSGPKPPALASIKDMTYVLRALGMSCRRRGMMIELRKRAVRAWLDDAEARGCGARGLALQIGLLQRFAVRQIGKKAKLAKQLASLRRSYAARGEKELKRKERFLLENPRTVGGIWQEAEALLQKAGFEPAGSRARHKLLREAAALALGVAVPLRIGDLHRFLIGEHLTRSAMGWALRIRTSKTRGEYARDALWPELTPFLDALIEIDAPAGDLWTGYDARVGTPLFSTDFGETGLSGDWISDVWEKHVGCGAHIIRTIWHQLCWESDKDSTWIALALCGQTAERTAIAYRIKGARIRATQDGRSLMRNARSENRFDATQGHPRV
jgi:hypothetical protein